MTRSAVDYEVRELVEDDEPAVLGLLATSLAGGPTGERTREFFAWKHRQNPFGLSPGLVAVAPDGALAGVRLLLRWELAVDGQRVKAVRAVDTATSPHHRGQGLFKRLTLAALDSVAADADLVFNTPNANSRPGYLSMGWTPVGEVPVHLRPVRPVRFLRGVRSSGQQEVHGPDAPIQSRLVPAADLLTARGSDVEALLQAQGRHPDRLSTPKDLAFLRWRYGRAPGLDYRAVVVDDESGLRGLGLGRLRRRGALTELTLGEVLTRAGDVAAARAVLRAATAAGTDHVATHLTPGTEAAAAGRRAAYFRVPGRGLALVANPRRPLPVPVEDIRSWALSLGDLEVF